MLRWSPAGADDLGEIANYIRADNPRAAKRMALSILAGVSQLTEFPQMGRSGRVTGTRELVFPGLPFLAIYRVTDDAVEIIRILHGRQRWPRT